MNFLTMPKAREFSSKRSLYESDILRSAETSYGKNCFLSHSSKDKEYLAGIIAFLESFGAKVYIDKDDQLLPKTTSRETAEGLKTRIKENRRLIILASTNSKTSRWIPWEIGLADGIKNIDSIAILPLTATDDESAFSWPEQEYLSLYNQIVQGRLQGETGNCWMVLDRKANTARLLNEWLS